MIKGNRGEWSEIYALFKLLAEGHLFLGDKSLRRIENAAYPIIKVLRSEKIGDFEYVIHGHTILIRGADSVMSIPVKDFETNATLLLRLISSSKERTFAAPDIEKFMQSIKCASLKASSSSKTDISIVIHDFRTNQQPNLGFSIKSQLGSPSTLLNAAKTTNFIYRIAGLDCTTDEIEKINSITTRSKIRDRVAEIQKRGGRLEFVRTEKQVFANNLVLVDSLLPHILSFVVLGFYSTGLTNLVDLVAHTASINPLGFDLGNDHKYYEYKIKRFLSDVALGMMPAKVWAGQYDATGGYLIVKADGDVLCYHIYNRNQFEDYLLNNTKLETASSSRHGFGNIYSDADELYFKLNLQIRFTK